MTSRLCHDSAIAGLVHTARYVCFIVCVCHLPGDVCNAPETLCGHQLVPWESGAPLVVEIGSLPDVNTANAFCARTAADIDESLTLPNTHRRPISVGFAAPRRSCWTAAILSLPLPVCVLQHTFSQAEALRGRGTHGGIAIPKMMDIYILDARRGALKRPPSRATFRRSVVARCRSSDFSIFRR